MENCNKEKSDFVSCGLFAASNSSRGFKSYYKEIFGKRSYQKLYIIKGGPGTGKSRFMREAAEAAEAQDFPVEYYYCSSDPDSLDAIIIDSRVVILDGTMPHSYECSLAGAREELIDLGVFWDSKKLYARREEIEKHSEKKSECYRRAYKYLAACGDVDGVSAALVIGALKQNKMLSAVNRLLLSFEGDELGSVTPAITDSIGMKGRVKLDTYENCAEKLYYVIDCHNSARFFLSLLITRAMHKSISMKVSYDPINTEYPDSVYFCNSKTAFVVADKDEVLRQDALKINMKRFIDLSELSAVKKELRYNSKLYEGLISSASDALIEAGESHFELERIYSSAMDFSAKERFTASFCKMLLDFLKSEP